MREMMATWGDGSAVWTTLSRMSAGRAAITGVLMGMLLFALWGFALRLQPDAPPPAGMSSASQPSEAGQDVRPPPPPSSTPLPSAPPPVPALSPQRAEATPTPTTAPPTSSGAAAATAVPTPMPSPSVPALAIPASPVALARPMETATEAPLPPPDADEPLARQIAAAMAQTLPDSSAVFISLDGRVVARHRSELVRTAASTIKLPLILEVLRQAEAGDLELAEPYTVRPNDAVGGSGELQRQVGRTLTLQELARLSILYSDNVAANVLLDHVGMDRVNATMHAENFRSTHFQRRFLDTEAQAQGRENWTTADDLAQMLVRLSRRTLLGPQVSERMLDLLKERGDRDPDWIGRGLPPNTPLSHLNGTLDRVRNDAGIVEVSARRAYVLVICQDRLADVSAGERGIVALTRQIHALVSAQVTGYAERAEGA